MDVSFGRKALRAFKIARAYLYYALPHRSHRKPFHWRMPEDVIWSWLGSGSGPVWATAKTPAILNTYWTDISLWKLMEIEGKLYIISAFKRIFSNHWKRLWYILTSESTAVLSFVLQHIVYPLPCRFQLLHIHAEPQCSFPAHVSSQQWFRIKLHRPEYLRLTRALGKWRLTYPHHTHFLRVVHALFGFCRRRKPILISGASAGKLASESLHRSWVKGVVPQMLCQFPRTNPALSYREIQLEGCNLSKRDNHNYTRWLLGCVNLVIWCYLDLFVTIRTFANRTSLCSKSRVPGQGMQVCFCPARNAFKKTAWRIQSASGDLLMQFAASVTEFIHWLPIPFPNNVSGYPQKLIIFGAGLSNFTWQ